MDTLRKMYFFHPRVHVIGLQKCMTTISGLLTIVIKILQPCNYSGLIYIIKTNKFYKCPYKKPPVLFMDIHVHISEKWFLIDVLHKAYGRATLPCDFRGER